MYFYRQKILKSSKITQENTSIDTNFYDLFQKSGYRLKSRKRARSAFFDGFLGSLAAEKADIDVALFAFLASNLKKNELLEIGFALTIIVFA